MDIKKKRKEKKRKDNSKFVKKLVQKNDKERIIKREVSVLEHDVTAITSNFFFFLFFFSFSRIRIRGVCSSRFLRA